MKSFPIRFAAILPVGLVFLACSSTLPMQRSTAALETQMGTLKTSAYAVVNSPKQDGEIYLAKNPAPFTSEGGIFKVSLDPLSFKNAYSFIEFSLGSVKGNQFSAFSILLQGDNFSDAYGITDASQGGQLECDGTIAHLSYKGIAESKMNGMQEPVDLQFYFEIPAALKSACP